MRAGLVVDHLALTFVLPRAVMPTVLQELSEDELVQVLTQPRNALHLINLHLPVYCHMLYCHML
jgi:ATP-dependent protease Clp ATPase subunit